MDIDGNTYNGRPHPFPVLLINQPWTHSSHRPGHRFVSKPAGLCFEVRVFVGKRGGGQGVGSGRKGEEEGEGEGEGEEEGEEEGKEEGGEGESDSIVKFN